MEPKLKTFLSSAQHNDEFLVEREGLPLIFSKQPLSSSFFLWRIEDYASPKGVDAHYIDHVDDSDVVILLLGAVYREPVENEYRRAIAKNKHVFAFIKNIDSRDPKMDSLIASVRKSATTANYSNFSDLVKKVESSLLQYFFRQSKSPGVVQWKEDHERKVLDSSDEEKSLRLCAGILASDAARATKSKVTEAIIVETTMTTKESASKSEVVDLAMHILSSDNLTTKKELELGFEAMVKNKLLLISDENKVKVSDETRKTFIEKSSNIAMEDNRLFTKLHNQCKDVLRAVDLTAFKGVISEVITQVVYDTAVDMAEQEFGIYISPFSYDADELNRVVVDSLIKIPNLPMDTSTWQTIVVAILQSDDSDVISWLNRQRKAYWAITVLGMNPQAIEHTAEYLRKYCIYLDSHVALRAIVDAGGESELCKNTLMLCRKLNIEMRLSQPLFIEVQQVIKSANKTYYAASKDIPRAMAILKNLNRKSDVFEGYLAAKQKNNDLSWDNYLNRFYSPSDANKLERYLENELGVTVQPVHDFSTDQLGRLEDITQRLLEQRRQMVRPPDGMSDENRAKWERQYLLRANEARQMAIVYELRRENGAARKQYWFVTFDKFVYEVSAALVAGEDPEYGFPCYMKPATWLEILANASPETVSINTYREVLLSRNIQEIADQLETEVISHMLEARVDQDIESIETLREMFTGIVSRPAVQEAYQQVLEAEGIQKIVALDKVKDGIIGELKGDVKNLKHEIGVQAKKVANESKRAKKAEGKASYLKRQLGRITSKQKTGQPVNFRNKGI